MSRNSSYTLECIAAQYTTKVEHNESL